VLCLRSALAPPGVVTDGFGNSKIRQLQRGRIAALAAYVHLRASAPELRAQGYAGSYSILKDYVRPLRLGRNGEGDYALRDEAG
jgi:hypothetical protein